MMEGTVLPWVRERSGTTIIHTPVKTIGVGEATLAEMIVSVEDALPEGTTVAYLPHGAGVDVMVSTIAEARERAEEDNAAVAGAISRLAVEFVYAVGNRSLEETILDMLRGQQETLAIAESCTGGLVASRITDVAGSSGVFTGGFVVYSNIAKEVQLGVSPGLLDAFGAVSQEVAGAMALGCLRRSGATIAIATTGIAGPGAQPPISLLVCLLSGLPAGLPAVKGRMLSHPFSTCMATGIRTSSVSVRQRSGCSGKRSGDPALRRNEKIWWISSGEKSRLLISWSTFDSFRRKENGRYCPVARECSQQDFRR